MTKRNAFISTAVLAAALVAGFNYFGAMKPLADVVDSDRRNEGVEMTAHYRYFLDPTSLVINVKGLSGENAPVDVFRTLLQFSEKQQDRNYGKVYLQSGGETKFYLDGDYFQTLGQEYESQNPAYTMRTFPSQVYNPDGSKAFGSWTGGLLGVLAKQMQDFTEFHQQWYIEDI